MPAGRMRCRRPLRPACPLHVIANQCAHWCGNPFSVSCMQAVSCAINFSSLARRKVAKEAALRRGRFRFLPLLRISLIETAKGARGPPLDSPGSGGKTVQKTLPPAPCSAKRSVSARKQRRQTIPRLHQSLGKPRISAGTGSTLANGKSACKRAFLFGVQEPFLFSGKYRKEKWVLICAAHALRPRHPKRPVPPTKTRRIREAHEPAVSVSVVLCCFTSSPAAGPWQCAAAGRASGPVRRAPARRPSAARARCARSRRIPRRPR